MTTRATPCDDSLNLFEDRQLGVDAMLFVTELTRCSSDLARADLIAYRLGSPTDELTPSGVAYIAMWMCLGLTEEVVGEQEADRHIQGLMFPYGVSEPANFELAQVLPWILVPNTARPMLRTAARRVGPVALIVAAVNAFRATTTTLYERPGCSAASVLDALAVTIINGINGRKFPHDQ